VEAAGVEPASENDHPRLLHTYLRIWVSSSGLLWDGYRMIEPEKF